MLVINFRQSFGQAQHGPVVDKQIEGLIAAELHSIPEIG